MNNLRDDSDLYLDDLNHLDFILKEYKDNNLRKTLIEIILLFGSDEYDKFISNIKNDPNKRFIMSIDINGIIHGLLLNLFLRSEDKNLKLEIQDTITSYGIKGFENLLDIEIKSSNINIDSIINKLVTDYTISHKNDMKNQNNKFLKKINQYYKDISKRLDDIVKEMGPII